MTTFLRCPNCTGRHFERVARLEIVQSGLAYHCVCDDCGATWIIGVMCSPETAIDIVMRRNLQGG